MSITFTKLPKDLEKKSSEELKTILHSLTKAKDEAIKEFRSSAGVVQEHLTKAIRREKAERDKDPAHKAKEQRI